VADGRRTAVDPLGHSLKLEEGDLVLERPAGDALELGRVRGVSALAQALRLTFETPLGSDPLNTAHGFDLLALGAHEYGVHTRKEYLKLHLVRVVGSDARIKEVRELFFDDEPRFFELHAGEFGSEQERDEHRSRVHASRRFTATLELETRAGDAVVLEVGGLSV
jgi:hypothetical protein